MREAVFHSPRINDKGRVRLREGLVKKEKSECQNAKLPAPHVPEFSVMFWHIIAQSPPGDKGAWPSIQILTRGRNHFWLAGVGEWISVLLPNENWALALPIEGGPAGLANRVQCQARRFLRPRQKVILPFHSAFRQCLQTSLRLWVLMASGLESKLEFGT